MENYSYQWQPPKPPKKPINIKKLSTTIVLAVLALVVFIGALTCFYTVDDKQQAVVTTFG